ncbi:hypothetical protein [Neosynechococcus sphagnicola]|uniref:hypothetical protein n=1 Tax=Neosynechococcus sphagnicola TaxID=1501145 RepID=UPI000689D5CA|nr:hypothetical protein [Neosynechococcus sphagnicola]
MNYKCVACSALIVAAAGALIGLAIAEIASPPFHSRFYRDLRHRYFLIGAGAGLLFGAGQESVRQLKKQQDQEEAAERLRQDLVVAPSEPLTKASLPSPEIEGKADSAS